MEEKVKLSVEDEQYWKQYDRFIEQFREEVKHMYWLYNFFFVIESAILIVFMRGDAKAVPKEVVIIFGVLISAIWFLVCLKQMWARKAWIRKVRLFDRHLEDEYRMWVDRDPKALYVEIFRKRGRISWIMILLPVIFFLFWVSAFFY